VIFGNKLLPCKKLTFLATINTYCVILGDNLTLSASTNLFHVGPTAHSLYLLYRYFLLPPIHDSSIVRSIVPPLPISSVVVLLCCRRYRAQPHHPPLTQFLTARPNFPIRDTVTAQEKRRRRILGCPKPRKFLSVVVKCPSITTKISYPQLPPPL
jgi:hypothetical protein